MSYSISVMPLKNHKKSLLLIPDSKCKREKFPEGQHRTDVIQERKPQNEGTNTY